LQFASHLPLPQTHDPQSCAHDALVSPHCASHLPLPHWHGFGQSTGQVFGFSPQTALQSKSPQTQVTGQSLQLLAFSPH
jgi:hypothetical protein